MLAGVALPRRVQVMVGVEETKQTGSQTRGCRELAGALVLALPRARAARAPSLSPLSALSHALVYLACEGPALSALWNSRVPLKNTGFVSE